MKSKFFISLLQEHLASKNAVYFWTCFLITMFSLSLCAQQSQRKEYVFRGKVEQLNVDAKRVTVRNEPIPGWMGAMTMAYLVENAEILKTLEIGDLITAKVYDNDLTLHEVKKVSPEDTSSEKSNSASFRLEDLEQIALTTNPTIAQAEANFLISKGLSQQAGLYPNPTVGYFGDEIRGGFIGGGKQGGFVSQTIVLGGKLASARRVAQLQSNQAETAGQIQRLRILNNVRTLFYQTLTAQQLVEVRENLSKLAADATLTSHQLGNIGQADRPDILQAEIEQQQAGVNLRIAQQTLQSSWRMLAAVVGKPDLQPRHLDADLETPPLLNYEQSVANMLRNSPEIKLAQQRVEKAEASFSQAKKIPIPDLELTGILAQNQEPLESTQRPIGLQGGAQIGVQLPLFNRNQGNVAAAKAEIESARQDLARLSLNVQRELATLFREYESSRVLVQQYKTEMLPRAEEAYKLYQAKYQGMAAAYPQALISQRTLFQLEAEYVQALGNVWQSALLVQGFNLVDGLSAPINAVEPSSAIRNGSGTSSSTSIQ